MGTGIRDIANWTSRQTGEVESSMNGYESAGGELMSTHSKKDAKGRIWANTQIINTLITISNKPRFNELKDFLCFLTTI